MAGRKRRKTRLPPAPDKSVNGLPIELLELILSKLTLRWNVHASLVCKRWQMAALSVRVINLSDVCEIVSAVGRKVDCLKHKIDVLSLQVDSLATAVAESDRKWSMTFREIRKELVEVKLTQAIIMSKSSEQRSSAVSSSVASDDELLVNLAEKAKGSNSDSPAELVTSCSKRTSHSRPIRSVSFRQRR